MFILYRFISIAVRWTGLILLNALIILWYLNTEHCWWVSTWRIGVWFNEDHNYAEFASDADYLLYENPTYGYEEYDDDVGAY